MRLPLEITYRNVPKTDAIEELVRRKLEKLERVCDYITSCRVAIERMHQRQETGNPCRVRVDITIPPGKELVASREMARGALETDVAAVVRAAFEAMRSQLQELVERQRGEVKIHPEQQLAATVTKIFREQGYGFIKTMDGRDVYFHRNSVLNDEFDRMELGTGVQFEEELGKNGPQATTVRIVDKPGARLAHARESLPEPPLGWEAEEK